MRQSAIFAPQFNLISRFKPIIENISLFQKVKPGVWSAYPATTRATVAKWTGDRAASRLALARPRLRRLRP
jgi:hypothetical protein